MDGFIYINKEVGWTSRDVCNKIQSIFHTRKVGHIGTLDPFATGLLVVTIGKGTKAGRFLEDAYKEYEAELVLGKKTSTGDLTGEIIESKKIPALSKEQIIEVLKSFVGEYKQIPPMTSALKINGQTLYKLAHEGKNIERQARSVFVNSIELTSFDGNVIKFKCNVSKGTYIRTLGEDIAEKLGSVGYLRLLNRTAIANIKVSESKYISEIGHKDIISISKGLSHMLKVVVSGSEIEKVKNGVSLYFDKIKNCDIILITTDDDLPLAVYARKENDLFSCVRGLW